MSVEFSPFLHQTTYSNIGRVWSSRIHSTALPFYTPSTFVCCQLSLRVRIVGVETEHVQCTTSTRRRWNFGRVDTPKQQQQRQRDEEIEIIFHSTVKRVKLFISVSDFLKQYHWIDQAVMTSQHVGVNFYSQENNFLHFSILPLFFHSSFSKSPLLSLSFRYRWRFSLRLLNILLLSCEMSWILN